MAIFISGCAIKYNESLNLNFSQKSFNLNCQKQNYIMIISQNGENFALFDTMMIPVSQKFFKNSSFKNSKFLPPSSKFDDLFFYTLKMIEKNISNFDFKDKKLNCKVSEF
ncbi:hypothetical protein CE91St25_03490 [Campylobacter ureolyticus]|uniref:hypothetical protein n=1 Tax=Campylobacter ureolyticus TaxID=827 RepID=UPI001FC80939|nr:hypothetical protein [Campylobacter ureolyticus]MCZ6104778.1 hypothetical protein [Campylobacter ureolyticus]GKH60013.1 hypothetical protein CE91St25_03490 [Campylobacter ureolyticus]